RAGLDALGAADAVGLDDDRHAWRKPGSATAVVGRNRHLEQARERARAGIAAGRAAVDARFAARHRLGIRPAAVESALSALGLRQQPVETLDQRGCGARGHAIRLPRYQRSWARASMPRS